MFVLSLAIESILIQCPQTPLIITETEKASNCPQDGRKNPQLLVVFPQSSSYAYNGRGKIRTSEKEKAHGNEWPDPLPTQVHKSSNEIKMMYQENGQDSQNK